MNEFSLVQIVFCLKSSFSLLIPSAAKLGGKTGYPYYLVIVRVVMGLFEAATFPCITSMLARWAPQSERSTMSTLIMAGSQAGTIVGFFFSGLLVVRNNVIFIIM